MNKYRHNKCIGSSINLVDHSTEHDLGAEVQAVGIGRI